VYCGHTITDNIYLLNEWEGWTGKYFSPGQDLRTERNLYYPSRGACFFQALLRGGRCLIERGRLFDLAKRSKGRKASRGRTCGFRALHCFF